VLIIFVRISLELASCGSFLDMVYFWLYFSFGFSFLLLSLIAIVFVKAEQMYPTPKEMEDLGKSLGLTLKEVRGWFKRRRSRGKGVKSMANDGLGAKNPQLYDRSLMRSSTSSRCVGVAVEERCIVGTRKASCQNLLPSSHILAKVFRKDGPSLGSEFDHLPSGARKGISTFIATSQYKNLYNEEG